MRERDVVSWNSLISLFCNNGCSLEAVRFFGELTRTELAVNSVTVVSVLSACSALENDALATGKGIHGRIIKLGLDSQVTVGNVTVDMYGKCGDLESSIRAFSSIAEKNVVSWNTIIGGLVHGGLLRDALVFFRSMAANGTTQLNSITISSFLPGLAELGFHKLGREVHGHSTRHGWHCDLFVANSLLDMYAKWGRPREAASVFHAMECRNVVSWNAMIANLAQNKCELEAIALVREMQMKSESPNSVTLTNVLPACARMAASKPGKEIHGRSIRAGLCSDIFISNALIDMYAKSGCLGFARTLFEISERDEVSYNALIVGYSRSLHCLEALDLFVEMGLVGLNYDAISLMGALSACGNLPTVKRGKEIHGFAVRRHLHCHLFVANSLLDLYTKRGHLDAARRVFDRIEDKDMQRSRRLKPNGSSLAGLLPAIARCGSLQLGKSCHGFMLRRNFGSDEFVVTALMDVYAKSGDLVVARKLFDGICSRNVISWSAMIAGCGAHGRVEEALSLFDEMLRRGIRPNHITYIGVLSACVHGGFHHPSLQHYTCMVDLLGRAGLFEEARELIRGMPAEPPPEIWGALMGACRIHGNVKLGKYAAEKLFELKPADPGFYVLLSNIYAAAHMWSEVRRVRGLMRELGLRKPVGWSSVEIGCRIHSFLSGDKSHPDSDEVYERLGELISKAKETGYVPRKEVVLHDVEDDVKESVLSSHSEKLAMAYGWSRLMSGKPIRIMKNLRTCEDCHSFAKFVSTVTHREIILRDAVRFHHIKDGICTCSDYW
ncbi:unnamed protein product [Spirodela intermedia]|uniref:DYW domain-containing protein n=1 Tax=Spirodela intermedia TaxID=51605 RepID=A0A7I8JGB5_SPIIN|nr:unnamed protein product [Spirodela intermedia]CAA6669176.1 unnamed protein product [Spirodela intermedia]